MSGTKAPGKSPPVAAAAKSALAHVLSFAAGLAAALVFSYVLYRIGLPSKPFIYAAF
jgi:hypothetical protein